MKRTIITVAVTIGLLAIAGSMQSQDAQDWANYGKPGKEHERLTALAGTWDAEFFTPSGEGDKWTTSKGTITFKSILGGRYLYEETKCQFGDLAFEWIGLYGFDPNTKKYTGAWADNADTSMELATAAWDEKEGTIPYEGEHFNPASGKNEKFQWVIKPGKDELTIEMFEGDKSRKVMTAKAKRKK